MNHREIALDAGLYLVSTPIGNARDITLRALDVLACAGLIAAEDTRTARKLMEIHGLETRSRTMLAYHDHSGVGARDKVVAAIAAGQAVAYVSEAGTPLLADPGFQLARAVRAAGHPVLAVPGASALLAAVA
ncbi:16S rRNA (cytidine(1402)-2'-O)-methyltransferase, partial [Roseovarius sp. SYSU LYC5161]|uniref:16S rRNA (cytidine(1402)-2'-O)-methyltransferase n=1 Tax=Roseovarius halophilus (ex Wu et al. 2025) TaxID=3376060 RepID=UPI00399B273A